ncbi:MAG: hypothetical protein ACUBOA_00095 [Candidatus Loosdrechtia sp.]|uniref:hypothetical protein n=1 Tax=Candidatus Loosdrechtia sp. TaxID=3101272 RepID=UPI003A64139E|nr:MAG: hypothetical protein QY305_03715 [Candidatus Jettenia sp. AMX2]
MKKPNKILSCIQVLIIVFLMMWCGGTSLKLPLRTGGFPCKEHQCGCKSEFDCMTNCCCSFSENPNAFQINNKSLHAFISSINCNYGNDPFTGITIAAKYIKENDIHLAGESFFCFLSYTTQLYPSQIIASRPEKPPRYFLKKHLSS